MGEHLGKCSRCRAIVPTGVKFREHDAHCRGRERRATEVERLRAEVERLQRAAAIIDERDRQDAKWGPQDHTLPEWIVILMEEVGELAAAALCHQFGNDDHPELDWRKEAIQVAAVALSMVEQFREAAEAAEGK